MNPGVRTARSFSPEFVASKLKAAAIEVFRADPRVRSLGVGHHLQQFGFIAIRNVEAPVPQGMEVRPIEAHAGIAVSYLDTARDPESLTKVIQFGDAKQPGIPEQSNHRPLVCGLEIQNFDDDHRTGLIAKGKISVGTIGCLVRFRKGGVGFVSNNHVVAGQNGGIRGKDRILQAGGLAASPGEEAGILSRVVSCPGQLWVPPI